MTKLGACVDELEIDLLQGSLLCVDEKGLSQGEDTLLRANATTLNHDEILLNLTIVGEATHGVDGLVRKVIISGGVVLHQLKQRKVESEPEIFNERFPLSFLTRSRNSWTESSRRR